MKTKNPTRMAQACLLTVALLSLTASLSASPVSPYSLNARVVPRPVTPEDVTTYGLSTSTEYSGGLGTIAIGTPAYLEVDVINNAADAATVTGIAWSCTGPAGPATLTASPLPTNMPVFLPSDRQFFYQLAPGNSRMELRPTIAGEYTVSVIVTNTSGTTNVSTTLNVGTYEGVEVCAFCHSGGVVGVPDMYPSWLTTAHASIFTHGIDGVLGTHYSVSCIKCHTTGYDTNASALGDGGFYGVQQEDGWMFPTNLANTNLASTNFSSMPQNLQNVANITCENCHGPGSQHAYAFGNTSTPGWPLVDIPYNVGACQQCHDDAPGHAQGTQWYASSHAVTTTTPTSASDVASGAAEYCVRCHSTAGFIAIVSNNAAGNGIVTSSNVTYSAIGCQTCHEPHGQTIPTNDNYLLRVVSSATFGDGTVVTNGGEGNLCMNCHHSRNGSAVTNVANWPRWIPTWPGAVVNPTTGPSSRDFGVHDSPQGDMLEGVNAITYGLTIPSSAHRHSVTNSCVGCHMQSISPSTNSNGTVNPAFVLSGGHTFEMSYNTYTTNGSTITTNTVDQMGVCNQCHGGITNFDFPVEDYANVGTILGVQTEVQILLNQLSTLLPNSHGVIDGTVKTSLSVTTNWTTAQLQAAYNFQFVSADGSLGIHNAPFATGLLNASIADLTGPAVPGSFDAWATNYFGSLTNADAIADAAPAGDGIPNWLKFALGLDPLVRGISLPNGVVYANGNALGGNTPTNTLAITTAADITWDTVAGTTYQIQEVTSLSDGWQNIGSPIVASNNASMSYLTPTAGNVQQYFRVVSTP
ncbi:MAG: multiheme c-type cytochrome [Limisphaerales bacterium]